MKPGDFVVDRRMIGRLVGQSTNGSWVVEWAGGQYTEFEEVKEEELLLVEETEANGIPSQD